MTGKYLNASSIHRWGDYDSALTVLRSAHCGKPANAIESVKQLNNNTKATGERIRTVDEERVLPPVRTPLKPEILNLTNPPFCGQRLLRVARRVWNGAWKLPENFQLRLTVSFFHEGHHQNNIPQKEELGLHAVERNSP